MLVLGSLLAACTSLPPSPTPDGYEAIPTGTFGPPGLAAGRVAASRPMILATFAPPGAAATDYVPYFSYDGTEWVRADFQRRSGESITALGVRRSGHYLFAGTSEGRVLRRQAFWVPATWEEVYAAPSGTFQPVVTGFAFKDEEVFVSLKGVLHSGTGLRFSDLTGGLGDLDRAIDRRGRFGTTNPAPVGNRLILSIGGLLPGATGTWVRGADERWERTELPGDHSFAVVQEDVVAIRRAASELPAARVSRDQGRSWIDAGRGAPEGGFVDVAVSNVGAVGLAPEGVFLLRANLVWAPLVSVSTDRSDFAVSGRDVYVPRTTGLERFRIERPSPSGSAFCGVEQTRQGREPYVEDEAIRSCLWDAYVAGGSARLISYSYTIEGGPVVKTVTVEGKNVRIAVESDDGFGFTGDIEFGCDSLERSAELAIEATGCTGPWGRVHI